MNTTFSFTLSPPRRTFASKLCNPLQHIYKQDANNITAILKYNRIKLFYIYPELDRNGRLHYHGVITMTPNQRIRWYKHARPKLENIGFIDTKELQSYIDRIRWQLYCKKEWFMTQRILNIDEPLMVLNQVIIKKTKQPLEESNEHDITKYFILDQ